MDKSTHAVVIFLEENSVAVVPRSWVSDGTKCSYPPKKGFTGLKKAVKNGGPPLEDWKIYDIKVFKWFGKQKFMEI